MIEFPKKEINNYYEYDSADGFAFLGSSLALQRKDFSACLKEVLKRDCAGIQGNYSINGVKTSIGNQYTYTSWVCSEFFYTARLMDLFEERVKIIDSIRMYPNGMKGYCTDETFYIVPNATSAAAVVYALAGDTEKVKKLLNSLYKEQLQTGNWNYYSLDRNFNKKQKRTTEDCFHVALILYHLREIKRLTDVEIEEMTKRSFEFLNKQKPRCKICKTSRNTNWLCEGSIGWGVPMMYLATCGLVSEEKEKLAFAFTQKYKNHKNFRVRSYSEWSMTKAAQYYV